MCPAPRGAIHAQNTFTACDVSPSREVRIILRVYIIYYIKSSGARAKRVFFSLVFQGEKKPHHNGSYEHRVPKLKNKKFVCTRYVCVTKHPPPSTALSARDANCSADAFYASTDDDDTRVVKTVGFAKWKASLWGGQSAVHITTAWGQTVAAILSTESDFQGPYAVILACGRREVEDACTRLTWFSCQRNSG